jgi:hypothetical protein
MKNERPRGKPRGIQERNPQELRSKLLGIYIPQERDKIPAPPAQPNRGGLSSRRRFSDLRITGLGY